MDLGLDQPGPKGAEPRRTELAAERKHFQAIEQPLHGPFAVCHQDEGRSTAWAVMVFHNLAVTASSVAIGWLHFGTLGSSRTWSAIRDHVSSSSRFAFKLSIGTKLD